MKFLKWVAGVELNLQLLLTSFTHVTLGINDMWSYRSIQAACKKINNGSERKVYKDCRTFTTRARKLKKMEIFRQQIVDKTAGGGVWIGLFCESVNGISECIPFCMCVSDFSQIHTYIQSIINFFEIIFFLLVS